MPGVRGNELAEWGLFARSSLISILILHRLRRYGGVSECFACIFLIFFRFFRVATTWHWEALRLQEAGIFFGVRCKTGRI